jgi:hypothetical protein
MIERILGQPTIIVWEQRRIGAKWINHWKICLCQVDLPSRHYPTLLDTIQFQREHKFRR